MTRPKTDPRAARGSLPCSVSSFQPNPQLTQIRTRPLKSEISNLKSTPSVSPFARRVYAALGKIPRGQVITYAALGRRIGCASPRAIGQALRANPFAPQVPCHRVIASDLTPGGFLGQTRGPKLARKLRLLATEGIHFKNGRLADPNRAIR